MKKFKEFLGLAPDKKTATKWKKANDKAARSKYNPWASSSAVGRDKSRT